MNSRLGRVVVVILIAATVLLLAVRFIGSPVVTRLANQKLARMEDYAGHVGGIHLSLWRATITATDFTLSVRGDEPAEPVVKIK
ncbi:MAG TPA: hypothetical protein VHN79_08970, partial [Lacunisphaera sp.]|nr:hypothetical protein [Lacunisphaera sp.]